MTITGKGIYIWQLPRIARGHVPTMVHRAVDAGLTHVLIKVADGITRYNRSLLPSATEAFRAAGIQVWGWGWLWLREPAEEATVAASVVNELKLDGFVINAEHPVRGRPNESELYARVLREELGGLPVGLSSYRYPHLHPTVPWEIFLSICDWNLPQVYWINEAPRECLRRSLARHQTLPNARPVVPTGAAYGETYGNAYFRAETHEITAFLDAARELELPGANFWSWDWTEQYAPDLWQSIADYPWPVNPEPPLDAAHRLWEALVARDLKALGSLYHENAVYVAAGRMVQGPDAIRVHLQKLLDLLPDATLVIDELHQEGNVRFLHWHATGATAAVEEGLDTIGIRDGRIQYHSSAYRLIFGG
jgi:hypothetical protein